MSSPEYYEGYRVECDARQDPFRWSVVLKRQGDTSWEFIAFNTAEPDFWLDLLDARIPLTAGPPFYFRSEPSDQL